MCGDGSVRAALRQATDPAHRRLHAHPVFAALLRGELSRGSYVQLLLRLYGLHAPLEQRLILFDGQPLMAWRASAARPSRLDRLRADLGALGADPAAIVGAPRADALL